MSRTLKRRYGRAALVPATYSKTNLVDANDRFFQLQPSRGGYIVEDHGELMGSIKKLKSGWRMSPAWAVGRMKDALERAMRLVDAYKAGQ